MQSKVRFRIYELYILAEMFMSKYFDWKALVAKSSFISEGFPISFQLAKKKGAKST